MWDVLEAAPHDFTAHGEADEVELGAQLQVVGELLDVEGDALLRRCRVRVALTVPWPVEGQQVDAQLLCQLLYQISSVHAVTITSCQLEVDCSICKMILKIILLNNMYRGDLKHVISAGVESMDKNDLVLGLLLWDARFQVCQMPAVFELCS